MVSSVVGVLLKDGVFWAFPVLLLACVTTVKFLVSYILWVNVLVYLDLLLVGGCTCVDGICAASSGLKLLIFFWISALFCWLASWSRWLASRSSCLRSWLNWIWSYFNSCFMERRDASCDFLAMSNPFDICSKHCSTKPVFVVTVLTLVLISFSCVVIWFRFRSAFASSRCRLWCCPWFVPVCWACYSSRISVPSYVLQTLVVS